MAFPAPHYIQFYPTLRCNENCYFCFNRGLSLTGDVTPDDYLLFLEKAVSCGVSTIDLLGGEPTCHRHILEMVDAIYFSGLTTTMSTNGSNLAVLCDIARKYGEDGIKNGEDGINIGKDKAKNGEGRIKIGVSLNGRASAGLDGFITTHKPYVKNVYTKRATIPNDSQKYLDVPGLKYFVIFMDALSTESLAHCAPFYSYYEAVGLLKRQHPSVDYVYCSGFIPDTAAYPILECVRCPAGTTKLAVLADGSAYPCNLLFKFDEFRLGNVFSDPFEKLWGSRVLDFFRTFSGNVCTCGECNLSDRCHGGCPAVSYALYNRLDLPDPRCNVISI
ncbi:MAG: radical SAM protein [Nitrospirae bacterium]|nr:radical SAM protein [Nitrospirota bacterium]